MQGHWISWSIYCIGFSTKKGIPIVAVSTVASGRAAVCCSGTFDFLVNGIQTTGLRPLATASFAIPSSVTVFVLEVSRLALLVPEESKWDDL